MNVITTTPIKDSEQKTIAYIVPAEKYEDLIELDALEDEYLTQKAKEAIAWWWATEEESKHLLNELERIWK